MNKVVHFVTFICFLSSGVFSQTSQAALDANDVAVLNYALFLERLEATFYNTFQQRFSANDFTLAGANPNLYGHLEVIRQHENAHVDFLETNLGTAAIANCTSYNFSLVTSVGTYVSVAKLLETTGVSAYDGAVNAINNRAFASAAATIATTEARHAAYLNNISTQFPIDPAFSEAFDPVLTRDQVVAAVTNFFAPTCGAPVPTFSVITIPPASAQITYDNSTTVTGVTSTYLTANDVKILQYALVLEHLENTFYATYNPIYGGSAYQSAGFSNSDLIASYMRLIGAHESAHVTSLTTAITSLGGSPLAACSSYTFSAILNKPISNVNDFLAASSALEGVGVSAYDYAIKSIYDKTYQQVAATIATIEGRHAAFVNDIISPSNNAAPFPNTVDDTLTPSAVLTIVSPIIGTCDGQDLSRASFDTFSSVRFNATATTTTTTTTSSSSTSTSSSATATSSFSLIFCVVSIILTIALY